MIWLVVYLWIVGGLMSSLAVYQANRNKIFTAYAIGFTWPISVPVLIGLEMLSDIFRWANKDKPE